MLGGQPFLHAYGDSSNLFVGTDAGNFTTDGTANTATGAGALAAVTEGSNNTASGCQAL